MKAITLYSVESFNLCKENAATFGLLMRFE